MGRLLNQIKEPNDIKRISPKLYPVLAEEIRDFLLNNVSQTGGHLASNLGAVEITMALHICLRFPEDKVVYDVGHQSYVHKILTGRKDEFSTLRQRMDFVAFLKEVKVNVMCLEQVTVPHRFLQRLVWQWQGISNKRQYRCGSDWGRRVIWWNGV